MSKFCLTRRRRRRRGYLMQTSLCFFFPVNSCSKRHIAIRITRGERRKSERMCQRNEDETRLRRVNKLHPIWNIVLSLSRAQMNRVTLTDGM